jgi:hypothetical protein
VRKTSDEFWRCMNNAVAVINALTADRDNLRAEIDEARAHLALHPARCG